MRLRTGFELALAVVATSACGGGGGGYGSGGEVPPMTSATFTNTVSIDVPTVGAGSLYPSQIVASGMKQFVTHVTVGLLNLAHTHPADIDVVLVGPGGQAVMIMGDVGDSPTGGAISGIALTLDQGAPSFMPAAATLTTGSFKPTATNPASVLPGASGLPEGPYATSLDAFNGLPANGAWRLYIADDTSPGSGSLSGWSLHLTASQ